jgi:hypothetical protein
VVKNGESESESESEIGGVGAKDSSRSGGIVEVPSKVCLTSVLTIEGGKLRQTSGGERFGILFLMEQSGT